jgi:hypothetical protein
MRQTLTHLSDEELLLVADREAAPRQLAKARTHLAQCSECRTRLTGLEGTLAGFISLHEATIPSQPSLGADSRAKLRLRLSEASRPASATTSRFSVSPSSASRFSALVMPRQWASACIALLMVAGSIWAMREIAGRRLDTTGQIASALPRRILTPGMTRPVAVEALCVARNIDNDPPVDPSVQQAVLREYGLQSSSSNGYQIDFLITPALGGSDDIQNLWPQSDSSTWNSQAKDQLENHLHELVCQGKVQLTTAQNDIATDWISAYKSYFNTDKPMLNTASVENRSSRLQYLPELTAMAFGRAPRFQ